MGGTIIFIHFYKKTKEGQITVDKFKN